MIKDRWSEKEDCICVTSQVSVGFIKNFGGRFKLGVKYQFSEIREEKLDKILS